MWSTLLLTAWSLSPFSLVYCCLVLISRVYRVNSGEEEEIRTNWDKIDRKFDANF